MGLEEFLLDYVGAPGSTGRCHVVVDRANRDALVGELDDNPGTSVNNALERVADAVSRLFFSGTSEFTLYQYSPSSPTAGGPATFRIEGRGGRFRMPEWVTPAPDDLFVLEVARLTRDRASYLSTALDLPAVGAAELPNVGTLSVRRSPDVVTATDLETW